MSLYVADFETTTNKDDARVWGYGICQIGNVDNLLYGTDIDQFMEWCRKGKNKSVYFHNLKFDGEFIFHWLFENGFTYSEKKTDMTFNCIISDQDAFYQIEVIFKKMNKKYKRVTFYDSLKKLPFSVDRIGKAFGLTTKKIEVEQEFYTRERPPGHELTDEEIEYIRNDVVVVATALGMQFDQDLKRMTVGSDALNDFKKVLGGGNRKQGTRNFEKWFPVLPHGIDFDIRQAYRGGFTYLKPEYVGVDVGEGVVFDVNSLYPSVMYNKPLPYSMPEPFQGKYEFDDFYPLYMQRLTCEFELKEGFIPTVYNNGGRFRSDKYLESSMDAMGNNIVTLAMTNVDLDMFFKHYDVVVHAWEGGWKFKETTGIFNEYIDHWTKVKEDNSEERGALYELSKLMLNSLYGKFASHPNVTGKHPYINDNGAISYAQNDEKIVDPVYTAMGAFITAWARHITISTAQNEYDRFIYADTDSIHLKGTEMPDIEIHNSRLGAWQHEGTFSRARFVKSKAYVEQFGDKLQVVCAGMPDNVKEEVTWENFRKGLTLGGKLRPVHVPGGIVFDHTTFTIS